MLITITANLSKGRDAKLKGLPYDGSQLPKDGAFFILLNSRTSIGKANHDNGKPIER
jgi:hypothetical protein